MPACNIEYDACVEDVFDEVRNHNTHNSCSKLSNNVPEQVVCEWSRWIGSLKFDGNSVCLSVCYPDKQVSFLLGSLQDDHSLLRSQVNSHAFNCHLNHVCDSLFHGLGLLSLLCFYCTPI